MDVYMIVLRVIHLFSGVFWVGTVFFYALFMLRRIREAGPVGGQFMQRLAQPPLPATMSSAAGLTVLSGILLYARTSHGFDPVWIGTAPGVALTVGGVAALVALFIGIIVSRLGARLGAMGRELAASGGPPSPSQAAEIQALSARLEHVQYWIAYLLVIALIGMAVARYL